MRGRLSVIKGFVMLVILLVILVLTANNAAAVADDSAADVPPWNKLEELIREQGFETSADSLMYILENEDKLSVATYAAAMLGMRGDREALPILKRVAEDVGKRATLREAAAYSLGVLGEESGLLIMKDMLEESSDFYTQIRVASRLAQLNSPDGWGYIMPALYLGNSDIQVMILWELSYFIKIKNDIGRKRTTPEEVIVSFFYNKNEWLRELAVSRSDLAISTGDADFLKLYICNSSLADASKLVRQVAVGTMLSWGPDPVLFCPSLKFSLTDL